MSKPKTNFNLFIVTAALIAIVALLGPEEQSLGSNVRIVYVHGAWVLTAEIVLLMSGLAGLIGLITPRKTFHGWSAALGRAGIFFWVTYLPLSMWAMQANWNGLFLVEPRFRIALIFAITGVLVQIGLWLMNTDWITSLANIIFIIVLRVTFATTANVLHPPPSPIFNSGNNTIIGFFITLILLSLIASYFVTRFFHALILPQRESK